MLHHELSTKTPGTQARLSEPDSCAHGPRRAHCFHTRCALRNEDPNHRRDGGVSSFFFLVMFDDVQIVCFFFNVSFDLKIPWLFLDGLKLLSFFMI